MKTLPILRERNGRIIKLNSLISFPEDFFVHWPSDIISFHTHTVHVCVCVYKREMKNFFLNHTIHISLYIFLLNVSWLSL